MIGTHDISAIRAREPERITRALAERRPGSVPPDPAAKLMIIAADHPARGALAVGGRPLAMADRHDLLDRCVEALARPGVHGFLGTAEIIEELTLLGALEGKLVYGSMNRGGLPGSVFEVDDRFTGYDADGVASAGLDGGKMLLRIDPDDPATATTLAGCASAVDALAASRLTAMVEPFWSRRTDGVLRNDLSPDAVIRSIAVAAGLGRTSAHTWLKLPAVDDMERVLATTTLPALILGGEVSDDADASLASWQRALGLPSVLGLVIGRAMLYPPGDDVARAVDDAVGLL